MNNFVIVLQFHRNAQSSLLSNEDIDFLTSEHCLTQWAGYSIEERCKLFHRKHINKVVKPAQLAKIYKLCGVKKKAIRYTKQTGPQSPCKYNRTAAQIEDELCESFQEGRLQLFCDEVVFTRSTNQSTDWSRTHQNIALLQKHAFDACTAVIAAVSYEQGIEFLKTYPNSVTTIEFCQYLKNLRKHFDKRPLSLFLDNLSVHRTADV